MEINSLLREYARIVKNIYGDTLLKIVLFGSYARGDYGEDSDVDVMIFLDVPPGRDHYLLDELSDATYEFNMEHDLYIMPILQSAVTFKKWEWLLPFYRNVNREGVTIYAA